MVSIETSVFLYHKSSFANASTQVAEEEEDEVHFEAGSFLTSLVQQLLSDDRFPFACRLKTLFRSNVSSVI